MKLLTLKKNNITCACCGTDLPKGDIVNKMNGKYYKLHCGKMYRLLVESSRRIKGWCNA